MRWTAIIVAAVLMLPAFGKDYEPESEIRPHNASEIAALKAAAETGDAKAELAYGKAQFYRFRQNGSGLSEADYRTWFQKAADQKLGEAWYWLAYTTADETQIRNGFLNAAELGFGPAFDYAFELTLFRAAENADPAKAKHLLDLAQKNGVKYYEAFPGDVARTINACYDAGDATVPENARDAIDADPRSEQSFTPNDSMKYAQAYANGWGVKADRRRALALVCHGSDVPFELIGMVAVLSKPATSEPFLFCRHVTSGMNGGQCSGFDEDKNNRERLAKQGKAAADFSPAAKTAFAKLQKAAEAYFAERAGSEIDMSGTGRDMFYDDELARLRDAFTAAIAGFEHGKLPAPDDFAAADRKLNTVYQDILKRTDWSATGTVKPQSLRQTQRKWIAYRDALAAFGTLRYPKRNAEVWKAWATRQRILELEQTFPRGS